MISEQAKSAIDSIFTKAARHSLAVTPGDSIAVEHLSGKLLDPKERHLFVLTIAGFEFKLLTIFHIDTDRVTSDYYSKPDAKLGLLEVFPELGNMCCGAMSRDLGAYFPHLGLSTPCRLDRQCLPHLGDLRPAHVSRHRITINNTVSMHVSLCLRAYSPIDFSAQPSIEAEETGLLELF